jgi:hypothetical protein
MKSNSSRWSFEVQPLESRKLLSAAHGVETLARPVQTETPGGVELQANAASVTDSREPVTRKLAANHNQTLVRA